MEKGTFESRTSPSRYEVYEDNGIDQLPARLGFIETEELSRLRRELIAAMAHESDLVGRYLSLGEQVVNQYQGDDFARAQIGRSIVMALIRREAGRTGDYLADLEETLEYAISENYDDIVALLEEIIASGQGKSNKHDARPIFHGIIP